MDKKVAELLAEELEFEAKESEELFNIKQSALIGLKKALDSISEAHNCVAEYNTEIDYNTADGFIDMNFLDEVSIKVQEIEHYMQWITEELAALNHEYKAITERMAA